MIQVLRVFIVCMLLFASHMAEAAPFCSPSNYPKRSHLYDQDVSGTWTCYGDSCGYQYSGGYIGSPGWFQGECTKEPQCGMNAERVNNSCQCKIGFKEKDGVCQPDKENACAGLEEFCSDRKKQGWNAIFRAPGMGAEFVCHAAENANSGGWSEPAFPGCTKGCMVSTGTTVSVQDDAGKWYTTGTGSYVGSSCDPNVINKLNEGKPDEKEVTPPDSKDPGKCNGQPGTVNGKDVCIPWSGAEGDNKTETKKNPDGSTTKTDTKTTCTGNSCTTTTTTTGKDSSGNTTGTTTTSTTTTKEDYCAKNSGSSVCGALDPTKKPGTGTGGGSGSGSGSGSVKAPTVKTTMVQRCPASLPLASSAPLNSQSSTRPNTPTA